MLLAVAAAVAAGVGARNPVLVFLRRNYLLFFVAVDTRDVFYAGITANPTGLWSPKRHDRVLTEHGVKHDIET